MKQNKKHKGGENLQIYGDRESFYQWDLNQRVTSDGMLVGDIIHFSNMCFPLALTVKAYELDGVVVADVPNILLQTTHPVKVFRYVSDETSAQTVDQHTFIVNQKPQPPDYFYTETELYTLRSDVERAVKESDNATAHLQEGLDNATEALELANESIKTAQNAEKIATENEQKRIENEEFRVLEDQKRDTKEETRNYAEYQRGKAEEERVKGETNRVNAENTRIENENNRIKSEDNRQDNEQVRIDNEHDREFNEVQRDTLEQERIEAETVRVNAEVGRQNKETARQTAENNRINAEKDRVDAEALRVEAENARIAAENLRDANFETSRNNVGNAVKGYASGAVVRADDVSPIEHTATAKVSGKNLLNTSICTINSQTINGVTITPNNNGSYTVSGENTTTGFVTFRSKLNALEICSILPSGMYSASVGCTVVIQGVHTGEERNCERTFIVDEPFKIKQWYCYIDANNTMGSGAYSKLPYTLYPQIEKGDTATEYEPYIDPATVTVTRYGADENDNSQTYTPSADGTCEIASLSPTMTLFTDTPGVTINLEYNQDTNKAMDAVRTDLKELDKMTAEIIANIGDVETLLGGI